MTIHVKGRKCQRAINVISRAAIRRSARLTSQVSMKRKKDHKKTMTTMWLDLDSGSMSSIESQDEEAHICFMAHCDHEDEVNYLSYNEQDILFSMHECLEKLNRKYRDF